MNKIYFLFFILKYCFLLFPFLSPTPLTSPYTLTPLFNYHSYTHIYTYTYTCMHKYINATDWVCLVITNIHTYIRTYIRTYVRTDSDNQLEGSCLGEDCFPWSEHLLIVYNSLSLVGPSETSTPVVAFLLELSLLESYLGSQKVDIPGVKIPCHSKRHHHLTGDFLILWFL